MRSWWRQEGEQRRCQRLSKNKREKTHPRPPPPPRCRPEMPARASEAAEQCAGRAAAPRRPSDDRRSHRTAGGKRGGQGVREQARRVRRRLASSARAGPQQVASLADRAAAAGMRFLSTRRETCLQLHRATQQVREARPVLIAEQLEAAVQQLHQLLVEDGACVGEGEKGKEESRGAEGCKAMDWCWLMGRRHSCPGDTSCAHGGGIMMRRRRRRQRRRRTGLPGAQAVDDLGGVHAHVHIGHRRRVRRRQHGARRVRVASDRGRRRQHQPLLQPQPAAAWCGGGKRVVLRARRRQPASGGGRRPQRETVGGRPPAPKHRARAPGDWARRGCDAGPAESRSTGTAAWAAGRPPRQRRRRETRCSAAGSAAYRPAGVQGW